MKRGFTLIEMVVVLLILSLVAGLAVRELGAVRASRREVAAREQHEELQRAAAEFLSDIGRLPKLTSETNTTGEIVGTLSELWRKSAALPAVGIVTNEGVVVVRGWNGPYIKLQHGATRLRDVWGNAIETPDDAGLTRLFTDEQGIVTRIAHYGARGARENREEFSLIPEGGLSARVVVTSPGADRVACHQPIEGRDTILLAERTPSVTQFVLSGVTPGKRTLVVSGTNGVEVVRRIDVKGPVCEVEVLLK